MSSPKISIIVPMFNVRPYVRQALESLVQQTVQEIEVVIVNDGSTDGSREIAEEFASRDPRFKIVDQPNGGYGKAVNAGLRAATAPYIGILEPDDVATKEMFATLLAAAEKSGAEITRCDFYWFNDKSNDKSNDKPNGKPTDVQPVLHRAGNLYHLAGKSEGWINVYHQPEIFFTTPAIWTCLYKKSFLDKYKLGPIETPGASFQDFPFFIEALFCAERLYAVDKPLLHYRHLNPTSSSAKGGNKGFLVFALHEYLHRALQARDKYKYERLKGLLYSSLFIQHYFHYERLDPKLKQDFLVQLRNELHQENRPVPYLKGNIRREYRALMNGGPSRYRVMRTIRAVPGSRFCFRLGKAFILPIKILAHTISSLAQAFTGIWE